MTNADKFKGIFGIYATELWAKPEEELLAWLNADVPDTNVGDTISRQAAIDAVDIGNLHRGIVDALQNIISELPSVKPERKKGHWKEKMLDHFRKYESVCSECGARYIGNYDSYDEPDEFNYCPNCGADMRGEEDG